MREIVSPKGPTSGAVNYKNAYSHSERIVLSNYRKSKTLFLDILQPANVKIEHLRKHCYGWKFAKAKKSSLVSGNRPVKTFLSPTGPHKANVYESICFLLQKNKYTNKEIPLANLFLRIYFFSLEKINDRAIRFSTKKSPDRGAF